MVIVRETFQRSVKARCFLFKQDDITERIAAKNFKITSEKMTFCHNLFPHFHLSASSLSGNLNIYWKFNEKNHKILIFSAVCPEAVGRRNFLRRYRHRYIHCVIFSGQCRLTASLLSTDYKYLISQSRGSNSTRLGM